MRSRRHELELRRYLWRVLEVAIMLAFIVAITFLFGLLMKYILPFVIGWIVAILLMPIVRLLERWRMHRLPAVVLMLAVAVLGVTAVVLGIVVGTIREATAFVSNSETFFRVENYFLGQQLNTQQRFFGKMPHQVSQELQQALSQLSKMVESWVHVFVSSLLGMFTHLPESLFVGVISVVTTFFILMRRERMVASFYKVVPPGWESKLRSVLSDMSRAFLGTIRVQFILMCMSALLGVVGMYILGIPYAVLLGVLFGLTGLIPILGSALLTVPWAVGALLIGDPQTAIKVIGLQIVISLIRHMIEPKILADSVGLDTLTTLFALYVGLKLIGVVGLFIGPIILIGAKGLLRTHLFVDFLPNFEDEEETRGSEP